MIIIQTGDSPSIINHPSRGLNGGFVDVEAYNMETRSKITLDNVPALFDNGLLTFEFKFGANEGDKFYLTILNSVSKALLFNSRVLATDETDLQDYQLTEGIYKTPPQASNEFKTY